MSCGCDKPRWANKLGRLRGPALAAGSQFKVGLKTVPTVSAFSFDPALVAAELEGCLYNTGAFDSLSFDYQTSYFVDDYLIVSGVTAIEFANVEDVGDLIAGQFQQCVNSAAFKSRDRISYTAPQSAIGNSAYGQGQQSSGDTVCPAGTYYEEAFLGFGGSCKPTGGTPGGNKSPFSGKDGGFLLIGGLALVAILVLKK